MKNIFCKTVIFFVLVLVFSCSQDPIFFTISTEPKPEKPRIQGGPTNIVVFKRGTVPVMYVASGDLHWYAKTGSTGTPEWDSSDYYIPQPGGKVIGLAVTGEHLYALCIVGAGVTTVLRRIGSNTKTWEDIGNAESRYITLQSIFADKNSGRLFAGAMNSSGKDYGILFLDDSLSAAPLLRLIANDTEMLSGAASLGDMHYLSTRGRGIFTISETNLSTANPTADQLSEVDNPDEKNRLFMGMIQLGDEGPIIVIERNGGTFFEVRESGFKQLMYSNGAAVASGKYATGALALWQQVTFNDDGSPNYQDVKMLIAGIQGGLFSTTTTSSYSHGYVEIELDSPLNIVDGWLVLNSIRGSISPDITVGGDTDRYTATIGKHPINHFYQAHESIDKNMTFFASTQTAGLWSYRDRDGGWQWNAEK